jgi:hypothetical protein
MISGSDRTPRFHRTSRLDTSTEYLGDTVDLRGFSLAESSYNVDEDGRTGGRHKPGIAWTVPISRSAKTRVIDVDNVGLFSPIRPLLAVSVTASSVVMSTAVSAEPAAHASDYLRQGSEHRFEQQNYLTDQRGSEQYTGSHTYLPISQRAVSDSYFPTPQRPSGAKSAEDVYERGPENIVTISALPFSVESNNTTI